MNVRIAGVFLMNEINYRNVVVCLCAYAKILKKIYRAKLLNFMGTIIPLNYVSPFCCNLITPVHVSAGKQILTGRVLTY